MYLCAFSKYSYLLGAVQFSFSPGGVWQHLHLKNPCGPSTNSAYYCHERAYHQIYQFHLEGVVLATAFVSKSELFEDKHGIVQSAPPPLPFPTLLLPFHSPTSKQKGLDEGLERNGKQIVHLYLGGDQTLEQILSAFSLYTCRSTGISWWGARGGACCFYRVSDWQSNV